MIHYDNCYDCDPLIFYVSLPLDADTEDLKIEISNTQRFEWLTCDDMVIRVHQPWYAQCDEVGDSENVEGWADDYDEFRLTID